MISVNISIIKIKRGERAYRLHHPGGRFVFKNQIDVYIYNSQFLQPFIVTKHFFSKNMYTYFSIIVLWGVLGSFFKFIFWIVFFCGFLLVFFIYFILVLHDDEWDVRLMAFKCISFNLLNLGFCYLSVILVVSGLHAGQLQFSPGPHLYLLMYSIHWPTDQIHLEIKNVKLENF